MSILSHHNQLQVTTNQNSPLQSFLQHEVNGGIEDVFPAVDISSFDWSEYSHSFFCTFKLKSSWNQLIPQSTKEKMRKKHLNKSTSCQNKGKKSKIVTNSSVKGSFIWLRAHLLLPPLSARLKNHNRKSFKNNKDYQKKKLQSTISDMHEIQRHANNAHPQRIQLLLD